MNKILTYFIVFAVTVAGVLISCKKYNDAEAHVGRVEDSVASISQQASGIRNSIISLDGTRTSLEQRIQALEADGTQQDKLNALKAADKFLEQRINELQSYMDNQLKGAAKKDWLNTTFATLDQYDRTCRELAKLEQSVVEMDGAIDRQIAESVYACRESMKDWVLQKMTGYYYAAELDAKLGAFSSRLARLYEDSAADTNAIKQLRTGIAAAKTAVEQARVNLTAAYRAAITTAINECDGRINVLNTEITEAQDEIDGISPLIEDLGSRMTALEADVTALEKMIQSVVSVPEFIEGHTGVKMIDGSFEDLALTFVISPASLAGTVASAFNASSSAVSVEWKSVRIYETKAGAASTLTVNSVSVKDADKGTISVIVDKASLNESAVKGILTSESEGLSVCLHIAFDRQDIRSNNFSVKCLDAVNIPDANFRAYCLENFDTDGDGKISYTEAANVTRIFVSSMDIESLRGIEEFVNLDTLVCNRNNLYKLDISRNTALKELDCSENHLSTLDVSKNTELCFLWCSNNQIEELDIRKNTALQKLDCSENHLSNLDVSRNTLLTFLKCRENSLTGIDVTKNTALTTLWCSYNDISEIDLSKNTELADLYLVNTQLENLDISNNTKLTLLDCPNNKLTILDIKANGLLRCLYCQENPLLEKIVMKTGQTIDIFQHDEDVKIEYTD